MSDEDLTVILAKRKAALLAAMSSIDDSTEATDANETSVNSEVCI